MNVRLSIYKYYCSNIGAIYAKSLLLQVQKVNSNRYGNRCPTAVSSKRMKDANAAITLLEK